MSATAIDYQNEYDVDSNGTIETPGKFEGEHISVPYFWDAVLNGDCVESFDGDTLLSFLTIGEDDLEQFPDLKDRYGLCLYESEQGFVNAVWFDSRAGYDEALSNPYEVSQ